jgi:hypothetical protein
MFKPNGHLPMMKTTNPNLTHPHNKNEKTNMLTQFFIM